MILRVIGVFHRYCISIFSQFLFVRLPLIKNIDCISSWGLSLIRFTLANLPSIFQRGKSLSSSFFFILLFSFFFSICVYTLQNVVCGNIIIKSNQIKYRTNNILHHHHHHDFVCFFTHRHFFLTRSLRSSCIFFVQSSRDLYKVL